MGKNNKKESNEAKAQIVVLLEIIRKKLTSLIDKMIKPTQLSLCVIIIFDMTKAFDILLDKWLIWLRDSCKYEGKVIILGYIDSANDCNKVM